MFNYGLGWFAYSEVNIVIRASCILYGYGGADMSVKFILYFSFPSLVWPQRFVYTVEVGEKAKREVVVQFSFGLPGGMRSVFGK